MAVEKISLFWTKRSSDDTDSHVITHGTYADLPYARDGPLLQ
jgi:hypothetical protein